MTPNRWRCRTGSQNLLRGRVKCTLFNFQCIAVLWMFMSVCLTCFSLSVKVSSNQTETLMKHVLGKVLISNQHVSANTWKLILSSCIALHWNWCELGILRHLAAVKHDRWSFFAVAAVAVADLPPPPFAEGLREVQTGWISHQTLRVTRSPNVSQ